MMSVFRVRQHIILSEYFCEIYVMVEMAHFFFTHGLWSRHHIDTTDESVYYDFNTLSTVSTVSASAPEWISASAPATRTVTATLSV